jgi:hypothetical protein
MAPLHATRSLIPDKSATQREGLKREEKDLRERKRIIRERKKIIRERKRIISERKRIIRESKRVVATVSADGGMAQIQLKQTTRRLLFILVLHSLKFLSY